MATTMDKTAALAFIAFVAAAGVFELAHYGVVAARSRGTWRARLALWWSGTAGPILLGALLLSPIVAGVLMAD